MPVAFARDAVFTPPGLARALVEKIEWSNNSVPAVADFAAGTGVLLDEAIVRWPNARIVATDIDGRAIRGLKHKFPTGSVGRCDFTNPASRRACAAVRWADTEGVDVILMNPPFTCRGGRTHRVELGEHYLSTSLAVSFLFSALKFLAADGEVAIILPAGTLDSEKDADAWNLLRAHYNVSVSEVYGRNTFSAAWMETIIARLKRRPVHPAAPVKLTTQPPPMLIPVVVYRGKAPVFKTNLVRTGVDYIHTTSLSRLGEGGHPKVAPTTPSVEGPGVLIPRVGRPLKSHVQRINQGMRLALSDCVVFLKCQSLAEASKLQEAITEGWDIFCGAYRGSGAKYVTLRRLHAVLSEFGYAGSVAKPHNWLRS